VRINIEVTAHLDGPLQDRLANAVCYETIVARVRRIVGAGHINLVETLAERIAEACLEDTRVAAARIRVEKLDVFADAAGAGVEIERARPRR
jgi:dihydroneopterin aldolase